jgi:hypothetical protein
MRLLNGNRRIRVRDGKVRRPSIHAVAARPQLVRLGRRDAERPAVPSVGVRCGQHMEDPHAAPEKRENTERAGTT